ncbi:hypothetical protein BDY21DRAFT_385386 [Lineolata rhizophorae]|uniref:Calcineurin-like phosphoesterase domain-containing protein n=1 Tax=Lineolata rhizophorae TaxID=578093 RepID=A0A6A6P3I1_9PEZI|nr:hypothetical protein BDY21DRAFT_385386 [Lineolata rhizophorae]
MRFGFPGFLPRVVRLLFPPCITATLYLYLYPLFHGCSFPRPARRAPDWCIEALNGSDSNGGPLCTASHALPTTAPFRLLSLGDPQLEGDTSLPNPTGPAFPSVPEAWDGILRSGSIRDALDAASHGARELVRSDVPRALYAARKRLDLLGNDYYLAHIYRTLHWWARPTHVTVLGDLLGSQWITDEEFERRGWRFWNRVFKGTRKVPDSAMAKGEDGKLRKEVLGQEKGWEDWLINIAGNHDVGYSGDLTKERVDRFERVFGPVNWNIKFELASNTSSVEAFAPDTQPESPELHLLVLNSMNLDGPTISPDHQSATYAFLNDAITRSRPVEDRTHLTILLTHIPLHKRAGVCVDAPFFSYHAGYNGGGVREQNHLSEGSSKGVLEGVFGLSGNPAAPAKGMGRNGVILTGHDHEGCDVWHHVRQEVYSENGVAPEWEALKWEEANKAGLVGWDGIPGVREVTVRSMMGSYGGHAGLLSAWFDECLGEKGEWRVEFEYCAVGVQHIWWAIHIVDVVLLGLLAVSLLIFLWKQLRSVFKGNSEERAKIPEVKRKVL